MSWRRLVAALALTGLFMMAGWAGLWYPVQVMRMTVAPDFIGEWRSADFHHPPMMEVWLMLMLAIAGAGRMHLPWPRK